jgi:hypothetical protein
VINKKKSLFWCKYYQNPFRNYFKIKKNWTMWLYEIYSVNSSDEYLCSLTVLFSFKQSNITYFSIIFNTSNWLFPVVFSVDITLSGSRSGNSFEFSHRLTGFLNYALFCLSFCLRLNLKPVNYLTRRSSMAKREG